MQKDTRDKIINYIFLSIGIGLVVFGVAVIISIFRGVSGLPASINHTTIEFPEIGETVYVKTSSRSFGSVPDIIHLSTSPFENIKGREYNPETDYRIGVMELYYQQRGVDTLVIYGYPEYWKELPEKFSDKIKVCFIKQKPDNEDIKVISTYPDTFQNTIISQSEIVQQSMNGDTLTIVSTNSKLFYPFGTHYSPEELKMAFPLLNEQQNKTKKTHDFIYENSCIKFILAEDEFDNKYKMTLLSATIKDKDVRLFSNIYVGMNKDEFLKYLTANIDAKLQKQIKVVKIVSGLSGIWHYYTIRNNRLDSIDIKSDYSFE